MTSIDARRTPLAGKAATEGGGAHLSEGRRRGMISLKGRIEDPTVIAAVTTALGVAAPSVRRAAMQGETGALWMATDELLLLTPFGEVGAKARLIEETTSAALCSVTDVSDARAILQLGGPSAREVLAKTCPVDLSPRAFGLGDARRSRVGAVAAAIVQTSASPETFEIYCFRSVADYVWSLLAKSAEDHIRIGVFDA